MTAIQKYSGQLFSPQFTQVLDDLRGPGNKVTDYVKKAGLGVAVGVATSFLDCGPMVEQLHDLIPANSDFFQKFSISILVSFVAPVIEEFAFRFLIQECLLTKIFKETILKGRSTLKTLTSGFFPPNQKRFLNEIASFSSQEIAKGTLFKKKKRQDRKKIIDSEQIKLEIEVKKALDSKVAIAARIILTSTLFAACHPTYDTAISAFIGGICLGSLKESQGGLIGTIAGHITNNSIATIMYLKK